MKFSDFPRVTLIEFAVMTLIACAVAGGGVFLSSLILGFGLDSAMNASDEVATAYFYKRLLWTLPFCVAVGIGMIHGHAYLYMRNVRRVAPLEHEQIGVRAIRHKVSQYEFLAALAVLAVSAIVFSQIAR